MRDTRSRLLNKPSAGQPDTPSAIAPGAPSRWARPGHWLCCVLLCVALAPARAQSPRGSQALGYLPPELSRLLGREDSAPSVLREHIAQLRAARPYWAADTLGAFLVYHQLALNFQKLQQADSAYACLLRGRRAGGTLRGRWPLETGRNFKRLGNHHWQQQAYDSARHYYLLAVRQFTLAEARLGRKKDPSLAGQVGSELALVHANAGLTFRLRGELSTAIQHYEQAMQHYEAISLLPGRVWTYELLGEAYEDQGMAAKAAQIYEQALQLARSAARNSSSLLFSQVLEYYADLLLRQGRTGYLLRLVDEGLQASRSPAVQADLNLLRAEALLLTRAPAAAAAPLAAAGQAIRAQQTSMPVFGQLKAAERRVVWAGLCAWQAARQENGAGQVRFRDQAREALGQLTDPSDRDRAQLRLATLLARAGDRAAALELLQGLEADYRRTGNLLQLREVYQQLASLTADAQQYAAAYHYNRRYQQLNDTLRAAEQYASLTNAETRYRTRQKEQEIEQLNERAQQQRRQNQLAWLSALLLLTLLGGVAWVLRRTRQLNRQLAWQRNQIQQQAEQLAELDRAKSQFFANVSHELRTPLTLIVGPVEQTLQQAEATWDTATLRERLTLTLRNGRRLQSLVNGLLDLSKLDAGRLEAHPALVQPVPFFRELLQAFAPLALERHVALTGTIDLPESLYLLLDADKAEKVVTNLLGNALKFTPAGGQVTVGLRADPGVPDLYRLTVQDTGPGIAPDEQARVFERFYQSRSHGERGGTGIGLALARELAELLGGSLTLTSQPGQGSTFAFTFRAPVAEPAATATGAEPLAADGEARVRRADGGRPRVLVVEDNVDLRTYLRQILAPAYDVLEAEHGRQALDILERNDVDLISSDAMMSEMDGMALLAHVRRHPRLRRLPFLMLTARAAAEHRLAALELGVDDYLPKPFLARELLARVRNLLVNYYERLHWQAAESDMGDAAGEPATPAAWLPAGPATSSASPERAPEPAPADVQVAADEEGEPLLSQLREATPVVLANPDFNPADLATRLGVGERTLYRRLKALTGLTPAAWLREVRLDQARQLLESRVNRTVAEVAYDVGFANPDYFGQVYYRRFGRRPSEYLY